MAEPAFRLVKSPKIPAFTNQMRGFRHWSKSMLLPHCSGRAGEITSRNNYIPGFVRLPTELSGRFDWLALEAPTGKTTDDGEDG